MLIYFGKRSMVIKKYEDHTHACPHCRAFDVRVVVRKSYYHLFFIPFFPSWEKEVRMYCGECGQPWSKGEIIKEYEQKTKNPIYLYSGLILIGLLIGLLVFINLQTQKEKAEFIANPLIGDTYLVQDERNDSTIYYFLRVVQINGDSIYTRHSNFEYHGYPANMQSGDFFVTEEELVYTKEELKKMLETDKINSVDREKRMQGK